MPGALRQGNYAGAILGATDIAPGPPAKQYANLFNKRFWGVGDKAIDTTAGASAVERTAGAATREGSVAARGGAGPVRAGQAGEAAVRARHDIGPKTRFEINGRERIADGITGRTVSEVKNVKYQGLTRQIRDYLAFAAEKDMRFVLYVRRNTTLSEPLTEAMRESKRYVRIDYID